LYQDGERVEITRGQFCGVSEAKLLELELLFA
jgi:hypothetical protein